ncbi:MAG: glycosyltransferase [Candidatus Methylomirabilia bacterium]
MQPPLVREATEFDLPGLQALAGVPALTRLRRLARRLHLAFHGRTGQTTVWHINSSAAGGGVADILSFLVPFSTEVGVATRWLVIGGDEGFFQTTKAFHNALQGNPGVEITEQMLAHYQRIVTANAQTLEELIRQQEWSPPDVIVFHDPQPAGLIAHWRARFPDALFVWRGHVQFDVPAMTAASHPGRRVWELLLGYVNQCDAAIFHLPEQVPPGVTVPIRCFLPSINPSGYLNRDLTGPAGQRFIQSTLEKYQMGELQDGSIPLVAQVGRFDPWKDPLGVIQAYQEALERTSRNGKSPHLLLAGPLAEDDPEAWRILAQIHQAVNGNGQVHILPLSPKQIAPTPEQVEALGALGMDPRLLRPEHLVDLELNAFQTRADVIIAKSIREGFGLAVTGAGYHGKPRIVSQVGGLPVQVIDGQGRVHACLVGGTPHFTREASISMTRDCLIELLSSPRLRTSMGTGARRHVIRAFLPHRHLEDYFALFLELRSHHAEVAGTNGRPRQFGRAAPPQIAGIPEPPTTSATPASR